MKHICLLWVVLGMIAVILVTLPALAWAQQEEAATGSMRAFADIFFELCALAMFSAMVVGHNFVHVKNQDADAWTRRCIGLGVGVLLGVALVWVTAGTQMPF